MMSIVYARGRLIESEIMDIMTYMFDEENNRRLFGLEQWKLEEKKGIEKRKVMMRKSKRL